VRLHRTRKVQRRRKEICDPRTFSKAGKGFDSISEPKKKLFIMQIWKDMHWTGPYSVDRRPQKLRLRHLDRFHLRVDAESCISSVKKMTLNDHVKNRDKQGDILDA
jgi:hypothetical protein